MKLNIGSGDVKLDGFVSIDRKFGQEAYPLPFEPNSIDEIRCSHMLEHLSFDESGAALRDWHNKMKPGARIRISVPDFDKAVTDRSDPKWPLYVMGGQIDSNDFHRSCYTREILTNHMIAAGFVNIHEWQTDNMDSSNLPFSLNLEGIKPTGKEAEEYQDVKIAACIGIPRIGWNDHWGCVVEALRPFGIPIRRHTGAFWSHNIQSVLEGCIADGLDWALTLDYDSMFTAKDISRMLEVFGSRPDIDALAALQTRRGCQSPLCWNGGAGVETDCRTPFKVHTAHFGLTLIRLDMLKDMPKPWFWDQPSASGSWQDDDRVDSDIYFWKQWNKHGRSLYIAPDVRIGHLEVLVSQLNNDMEFEQVHVTDWWKRRHA